MTRQETRLAGKALDVILAAGVGRARFAVESHSRTLGRAVTYYKDTETEGAVHLPHYWAVYLHDGRGRITMPPGQYLVWFRNPLNDPRLRGGNYPVTRREIRRLSKVEFEFWLEENRRARRRKTPVPMIIARSVGPTKPTRFFSNNGGMFQFWQDANFVARDLVQSEMRKAIGEDLLNIRESLTFNLF